MKRWPIVVAAVAFVVFVLTACNPVIAGDSIMFGAQVHGATSALPNAYIDADPGRSIRGVGLGTGRNGIQAIGNVLPRLQPGGWLVLELGTNDLPSDPAGYRTRIADMLSVVPPPVCVGLVTVANWSSAEAVWRSVTWNDQLRQVARTRSCYRIIDWWENTRGRPQVLAPDLVHPNAQGEKELATMIAWLT